MLAHISFDLQQARRRRHNILRWLGIVIAPISFLLRILIKLLRILGLESAFFRTLVRYTPIQLEQAFSNYTPTQNDIFVCSYFKSGTNWTMQIAHQIANRGQGEYEHIHDVVAWPDVPMKKFAVSLYDKYQSTTGLRTIKTHLEGNLVPYNKQAKYICVVRDPKDVFVSSYFFMRSVLFGKLMPSVASWLDIFLSQCTFHGSWANFLHSYWSWRHRSNVLFLTFEETKDDLPGVIRKIAHLVGVELTPEEFKRVCHLSSYDYMKTIDHKFYPGRITPFSLPTGKMIRSGKKKNASELLTSKQQERIDTYSRQCLENLGCDFPYDDYYKTHVPS